MIVNAARRFYDKLVRTVRAALQNIFSKWIAASLVCISVIGCSKPSKFEGLVGKPSVDSRVESGARFRREYYVFLRIADGASNFELIRSKVSSEFGGNSAFDPGFMKFELGKFGHVPDISKWFDGKYSSGISRQYFIGSKDHMHVVDVYESSDYVCVILADGS